MRLAQERTEGTASITSSELKELWVLRKTIFDSQVRPAILSQTAWLRFEEPNIRGAKTEEDGRRRSEYAAQMLGKLGVELAEIIESANTGRNKFNQDFDSYYLRLYQDYPRSFSVAPPFHFENEKVFDSAVAKLLTHIQGTVPLKASYSWEELGQLYKSLGKQLPPLPEALIYVDDPDGGVINDRLNVSLPTRIPLVFAEYAFRLWGQWEGQTDPKEPVYADPTPNRFSIRAVHSLPQRITL